MLRSDSRHECADNGVGLKPLNFCVFSDQGPRTIPDNNYYVSVLNILRIDYTRINIYIIGVNNFTIFYI